MWHGLDTKLAAWNRREGRIHTWTMEEGGERGRQLSNRGKRKRAGVTHLSNRGVVELVVVCVLPFLVQVTLAIVGLDDARQLVQQELIITINYLCSLAK